MQPFNLPITVGGIGSAAHVFYFECCTQSVEFALEFSAVISSHFCRCSEHLKNLLFYGVGYRLAAFVFHQRQNAKLAEAAYCTQHVRFALIISDADNEVQ